MTKSGAVFFGGLLVFSDALCVLDQVLSCWDSADDES